MPVYEFFCHECNATTEQVFKIADRKQFVQCPKCEGMAERIISGHVRRDEPVWLASSLESLCPDRPIENRSQFNRYLRDKGIMQIG